MKVKLWVKTHECNTAMIFLACECGRQIGYVSEGKGACEDEAVGVVKVKVKVKVEVEVEAKL